jgi:hypothetical protein
MLTRFIDKQTAKMAYFWHLPPNTHKVEFKRCVRGVWYEEKVQAILSAEVGENGVKQGATGGN